MTGKFERSIVDAERGLRVWLPFFIDTMRTTSLFFGQ